MSQDTADVRLWEVRERVSNLMDDVLNEFKPGARITVLVRTPGNDNADMLLTNDSMDEIAKAIERSKTRPER